jgi:hypothetical protein
VVQVGLFLGRQADADKPELGPAASPDDASREAAERTERENPGWIVLFGVFTREFVCFPKFPAPAGTIIRALYPDAVPPRMRMIERALGVTLPGDETT